LHSVLAVIAIEVQDDEFRVFRLKISNFQPERICVAGIFTN